MSHPMRGRFMYVDWGQQMRAARPDRIMRWRPNVGAAVKALPRPGFRITPHPGVMIGILLLEMIPPYQPITAPIIGPIVLPNWVNTIKCATANAGPFFGLGFCNGKDVTQPGGARMGWRTSGLSTWADDKMDFYNEGYHPIIQKWVADKAERWERRGGAAPYNLQPIEAPMEWAPNPNDVRVQPFPVARPGAPSLPGRPAKPVDQQAPTRPFPRPIPAPQDIPQWRWDAAPAAGQVVRQHVRAKPDRMTRERKVRSLANRLGVALFQALDFASESAEVVDALYDALPDDVKKRWGRDRPDRGYVDQWGQYGIDGADWKLQALFHNFHKVDLETAIRNVLKNQLEDKLIGRIQRHLPPQLGQLSVEWNRKEGQAMMTVSDFVDWMVDHGGDADAILLFYQELLAK